MYFLSAGIVLLLLKYLELGPVAGWSWLVVLTPFGLALLWWAWADSSGYTRRKQMEKMDQRKADRIEKQRKALGLDRHRR